MAVKLDAVGVYASPTQNVNKKQPNFMIVDLNGIYVEHSLVAVIRESSLDSDQTVIFTPGQSAIDGGHLIDMPVEEVIEALNASHMQAIAERLLEDAEAERLSAAQS
ncbi:MAG TPA: hypothetical protein VN861_03325 [Candidatus Acidoferrales bacterium]|nr:hypothetical protein [Candidatus Acidoferrales bacterium]